MANVFYSRFAVEGLGFRALTSAMPIDNVPHGSGEEPWYSELTVSPCRHEFRRGRVRSEKARSSTIGFRVYISGFRVQ